MEKCYPKWIYHPEKGALIVRDEAEHEAMGSGWAESPADDHQHAGEKPSPKAEPKKVKTAKAKDGAKA